jgi:hypothetical protein
MMDYWYVYQIVNQVINFQVHIHRVYLRLQLHKRVINDYMVQADHKSLSTNLI